MVYEEFLKTGDHSMRLGGEAYSYDFYLKNPDLHLKNPNYRGYELFSTISENQRKAYEKFLSDINEIKTMLSSITGKPKEECPFRREVEGKNGYCFLRDNYLGRYVISITKNTEKLNFYWTIGVKYKGNSVKVRNYNELTVVGYHHIGTNGNLVDLREALDSTKDFFPVTENPIDTENEEIEESRKKGFKYLGKFDTFKEFNMAMQQYIEESKASSSSAPPIDTPQVSVPPIDTPQVSVPPINTPQVSAPPIRYSSASATESTSYYPISSSGQASYPASTFTPL